MSGTLEIPALTTRPTPHVHTVFLSLVTTVLATHPSSTTTRPTVHVACRRCADSIVHESTGAELELLMVSMLLLEVYLLLPELELTFVLANTSSVVEEEVRRRNLIFRLWLV